jgi:membrane-bound lytic murein transglycosylase B
MVDRGHIDASSMRGSWAGAMGQPQFMPSSYLAYAADFDGDGRRDIWTSDADTFASIANYLKGHGWREDEAWGREVRLGPAPLSTAATEPALPPSEWCGVPRRVDTRLAGHPEEPRGECLNGAVLAVFPPVHCPEGDIEVAGELFLSETPSLPDQLNESRKINVTVHGHRR